jgi:hypothetical protein
LRVRFSSLPPGAAWKVNKGFGLPGEFAHAVEFFSAHDNDCLSALLHYALWPVGANPSEQLAELRLRFVQLPHPFI